MCVGGSRQFVTFVNGTSAYSLDSKPILIQFFPTVIYISRYSQFMEYNAM